MKLVLLLLTISFLSSACSRSTDLTVKADDQLIFSENTNANKSPINTNIPIVQHTGSSILESKHPIVFSGFITSENGEVTVSGDGWTLVNADLREHLEQKEVPVIDDETTIKVDVMTCAGYLGSGIARYDSGNGIYWKIQIMSETMPKDISERFNLCSGENAANSDSIIMRSAFAVESQGNNRRNITIKTADTRKLFASLPQETKKLLNNKYNAEMRGQNNLSIAKDNWTDIDGDGNIDLVELSNKCGDFECGLILYLMKGKWVKIGEVQPA